MAELIRNRLRSSGSSAQLPSTSSRPKSSSRLPRKLELREEAAQRGDAAAWHIHDCDCETFEHDWDRYYRPRPQQQQVDPRMAGYFKRKKTFLDRHGNAAANAMDMAHQYATRPRTGSTNPAQYWNGLAARYARNILRRWTICSKCTPATSA